MELEKEYKAALQDVNTTRDAIGKLKPRKGSADLTLIKRVHSSVIPRAFTQLRAYPVSSELRGTCFCQYMAASPPLAVRAWLPRLLTW